MSYYDLLETINAEIAKCMKCGNCQAVCPIYKEDMAEWSVARGKIKLAKDLLEGRLDYTPRIEEIFSLCLTCQACAENCPCGVRPDKIILATRAAIARAKGLPERVVLLRHAMKPALLPVISYLGPATAAVITGSVVIEQIFGVPGLGRYFVQGALNRDYTLVMGVVVFYGVLIIVFNLLVDLLYALLDPRVKY